MTNTDTRNTFSTIISSAFEKWSDKLWFQGLMGFVIIYLLLAPIVVTFVQCVGKHKTTEAVVESLEERDKQIKENHKLDFETAKQTYAAVKNVMRDFLEPTSSDYIFLFEYHNGMENVMSGIQFCHFDMTLEVLQDYLPYVPDDKFRNEYVARYDILLDPNFDTSSKAFYYKTEDLKHVDRYFMQCINYIECKSCVLINISNETGVITGTLLFASKDEHIDISEVYECQREVEKSFKQRQR